MLADSPETHQNTSGAAGKKKRAEKYPNRAFRMLQVKKKIFSRQAVPIQKWMAEETIDLELSYFDHNIARCTRRTKWRIYSPKKPLTSILRKHWLAPGDTTNLLTIRDYFFAVEQSQIQYFSTFGPFRGSCSSPVHHKTVCNDVFDSLSKPTVLEPLRSGC